MWNLAFCLNCGTVFSTSHDKCPHCKVSHFVEIEEYTTDGKHVQPHGPCPWKRGSVGWQLWMKEMRCEFSE